MRNGRVTAMKLHSLELSVAGLLALAMLFAAATAMAQSASATIGVLTPGLTYDSVLDGLREGLAKFGYHEGKNLTFTVEDSKGETANLNGRAAKLIETKPDLIFTVATAHSAAAKQATATIPIVFSVVGDPVHAQLAASFASSRNNVTGVSSHSALLTAKRLELLKDLAPRAKSVLVIVSISEASAKVGLPYLDEPAKKMGLRLVRRDVSGAEEFEKLLAEKWTNVDAVFPMPSVFVGKNMPGLVAKANRERLPLIVVDESWVQTGALASYGSDFRLMGAQSAKLVVKVLKGTKPADIPIETPDPLVLTINRSAAKAIGLKIPEKILERADRIFD
jgi:putative ABC transport system substrate-binding protein